MLGTLPIMSLNPHGNSATENLISISHVRTYGGDTNLPRVTCKMKSRHWNPFPFHWGNDVSICLRLWLSADGITHCNLKLPSLELKCLLSNSDFP